jgi:hypothetical protein
MASRGRQTEDEARYNAPPPVVWEALKGIVAAHKGIVPPKAYDDSTMRVQFETTLTANTWGHSVVAHIVADGRGSRLHVSGTSRFVLARRQDALRLKKLAGEIFGQISERIPSDLPLEPSNSETVTVADELAKLAALRDSGLLTEREFQAQKEKLLSQ